MKKIIHLILILLLASPAWAVVYYVDCNAANDSGAGTSTGTAWKTINKVIIHPSPLAIRFCSTRVAPGEKCSPFLSREVRET